MASTIPPRSDPRPTPPPGPPPINVVVIDDSAYNRQTIATMIESQPGLKVVGRAADGDEGLKLVLTLQPDIVTLDLEMPRMDGFTFLRILMAKRPTPVVVISSLASKENVFKALELGALDFVAKPGRQISPELRSIRDDLVAKIRLVTQLRAVTLAERAARAQRRVTAPIPLLALDDPAPVPQLLVGPAPLRLVALGASTGGPPALLQLLAQIDPRSVCGIVITQHMPPKFTRAFAERLQRLTRFPVREAETGDYVLAGTALVAPGSGSMILHREGASIRVVVETPPPDARFVPSVDRMFETAAQCSGAALLGVVLTGMGGDGVVGVKAIKARGGRVIAESPESAVIAGMPQGAIASGAVDEILPLGRIAEAINHFAAQPLRGGERPQ